MNKNNRLPKNLTLIDTGAAKEEVFDKLSDLINEYLAKHYDAIPASYSWHANIGISEIEWESKDE